MYMSRIILSTVQDVVLPANIYPLETESPA